MKLQEIRSEQEELLKNPGAVEIVRVSDVAKYFIPDWATGSKESRNKGTAKHEEVEEEAETISKDELWEQIEADDGIFPEFLICAKSPSDSEVVLSGKIDMVCFKEGKPVLVLERKFPNPRNLYTVYESEKVQAYTYCLMLDQAGFDTSDLKYCILKMDRDTPQDARRAFDARLIHEVRNRVPDSTPRWCSEFSYDCKMHLRPYKRSRLMEDFEQALKYELTD